MSCDNPSATRFGVGYFLPSYPGVFVVILLDPGLKSLIPVGIRVWKIVTIGVSGWSSLYSSDQGKIFDPAGILKIRDV